MRDVLDPSWSPDSASLMSGSVDNHCMIWDVATGTHAIVFYVSPYEVQVHLMATSSSHAHEIALGLKMSKMMIWKPFQDNISDANLGGML